MKRKTEQKNPQGIDKLAKAIEKQTGGKVKMVRLGFNPKRMVMWLVVIFFVLPFFLSLFSAPLPAGRVGLSQLLNDIKEKKIEKISVEEEKLLIKYLNRQKKPTKALWKC